MQTLEIAYVIYIKLNILIAFELHGCLLSGCSWLCY